MKIYLVNINKCSYDQYDSFVVRASDEKEAEKIIRETHQDRPCGEVDYSDGLTVKEVTEAGECEIILGSFNAG